MTLRVPVKQVMSTKFHTVPTSATTLTIAQIMEREDVGCLLVEQAGALVGIVTDQDVVKKAVARNADLMRLSAQEIMSYPLISIEETASLEDAHRMMGAQNLRHLLVTRDSAPVGVLSVRDLLNAQYDTAS